jgi:hypothetical protein
MTLSSSAESTSFIHNIQNNLLYFKSRRSWSSHVGNTVMQNSHIHKGGDGYLQMCSYLNIFLVQMISHHSITYHQTVHEMHIG